MRREGGVCSHGGGEREEERGRCGAWACTVKVDSGTLEYRFLNM